MIPETSSGYTDLNAAAVHAAELAGRNSVATGSDTVFDLLIRTLLLFDDFVARELATWSGAGRRT